MDRSVRSFTVLATASLVLAALDVALPQTSEGASGGRGTLAVVLHTPKGIPASVSIDGVARLLATKAPKGTSHTDRLRAKAGRYTLRPQVIAFHGKLYRGTAAQSHVRVRGGSTTKVLVTYRHLDVADGLTTTKITSSSVSFTWHHVPKGARLALRRATGNKAPVKADQGHAVKLVGAKATDKGLKAGQAYSYSLFTKVGKGWRPPVSVTVGTATATGAAYTTPPSSLVIAPGTTVSATPTGSGVTLALPHKTATPIMGAGVALPVSTTLVGGYLGVVTGISDDGRTVTLSPGGLADVFDYYDVTADLSSIGKLRLKPITDPARADAALRQAAHTAAARAHGRERRQIASAAVPSCLEGDYAQKVTLKPVLAPHGHFDAQLKTKWGIPTGATFDVRAELETGMKYDLAVEGSLQCGLPLEPVMKTFTVAPIPISVYLEPIANISVTGSIEVADAGMTVTGGFWTKGQVGLHNSVDGGLIAQVNQPDTKSQGKVAISASLGGQLIVGPGAGTAEAGVIAGISGTAVPIKLEASSAYPVGDVRYGKCLRLSAGAEYGLGITAKAWMGKFSASKTFTLEALNAAPSYGSLYLPSGCDQLPSPDTTLLGPGVTLQDSTTTGDPNQWGHLAGFAPGENAWVLSTGLISSAVGSPDDFASTDLSGSGNATLTAMAGNDTFDAASYALDVVPSGSHLHIRFAFASEEYPEFVDAGFNDVMGVFVNGQNCGLVPGTSLPVSVDNVNDHTNAQYYVDNSAGASGYQTSMDGLTVPITCNATVTPGQPVHLEIAVADVGDHIYDSAVALLDGGIWAD